MKKTLTALLLVLTLFSSALFAAAYYENGSQVFTISAGTNIPLFAKSSDKIEFGPGSNGTNFTVGGFGSIDYEVFLHPYIAIGGELGYQFNFIADGMVFSSVPILFKATYVPLQGTVELPISLGLGLDYLSYNGKSKICMMGELNVGVRYFFNQEWGMGLNTGLTFTPEFYSDKTKNGMIGFVPINLTVNYRH